MKFISLFAGIGGFDLGLERSGMECVGQVEINPYCQAVLAKHWPTVKRVGDIRNVAADTFPAIDLVCGGFPCQPFSLAGKRAGAQDDRYLWPEMLRVIQAYRPAWVIGENVAGLIGVELDKVLADLESIGYSMQCFVIPACAVDAQHRRDRIWIVAHTSRELLYRAGVGEFTNGSLLGDTEGVGWGTGRARGSAHAGEGHPEPERQVSAADSNGAMLEGREQLRAPCEGSRASRPAGELRQDVSDSYSQPEGWPAESRRECCLWEPEPGVDRVANGIPGRVDRLRALGNAVVPQVVEEIGRVIMQIEEARPAPKTPPPEHYGDGQHSIQQAKECQPVVA